MATFKDNFKTDTVTIANGATASSAIDLQGFGLIRIKLPSAFTGTTITFQASEDNSTFYDLYNTANTQLSMTVTQGRGYVVNPSDLVGVRYLKLISGSSEGGDRTLTLISRELG